MLHVSESTPRPALHKSNYAQGLRWPELACFIATRRSNILGWRHFGERKLVGREEFEEFTLILDVLVNNGPLAETSGWISSSSREWNRTWPPGPSGTAANLTNILGTLYEREEFYNEVEHKGSDVKPWSLKVTFLFLYDHASVGYFQRQDTNQVPTVVSSPEHIGLGW